MAQREDFGERVRQVLGKMSLRGAMLKTGIDHTVIGKMRMGFVPRSETVIRFARGFGLGVNEWLVLCGYEPNYGPADTTNPRDLYQSILAALLAYSAGLGLPRVEGDFHHTGDTVTSTEQAKQRLRDLVEDLSDDGTEEQRAKLQGWLDAKLADVG